MKPRSNGPAYNGIPPITEKYLSPFIIFYSYLYIGYNRNPPITDKYAWPLKSVRAGVNCSYIYLLYEVLIKKGVDRDYRREKTMNER